MSKHYQVIVKDDGKTFVRTLDGAGQLSPDESAAIAKKIETTATEPTYVYIGYQASTSRHKIGLSIKPPRRAKELDIEILHTIKCQAWGEHSARKLEQILHRFFTLLEQHIEGEWFHLNEFDLWDLKDTGADYGDGWYHKYYLDLTEHVIDTQATYNETKLPNPFHTGRQVWESFLKWNSITRCSYIYGYRWLAKLAERTPEKMLAGFMKDFSDRLEEQYLKECISEKEEKDSQSS